MPRLQLISSNFRHFTETLTERHYGLAPGFVFSGSAFATRIDISCDPDKKHRLDQMKAAFAWKAICFSGSLWGVATIVIQPIFRRRQSWKAYPNPNCPNCRGGHMRGAQATDQSTKETSFCIPFESFLWWPRANNSRMLVRPLRHTCLTSPTTIC